ncbi:MAG: hypothetical protein RI911_955 [Candidatus Parcubacteria bacterium]|jgi:UDP-N-acetylmuramate dehydrogenase
MNIQEFVPLAPYTTFQIGGSARYFISCNSKQDILDSLTFVTEKKIPFCILAGGSNVLIADEGFDGCVLHINTLGTQRFQSEVIIDAGVNLLDAIQTCHRYSLGGWEKLSGIPGTVGAGIRGNVGAFGSEIREFCISVQALNMQTFEERTFTVDECEFTYRNSFFKENAQWLVLSGTFKLLPVTTAEAAQLSTDTIKERERRHLQNIPCAGSYFMNPVAPQWVQDLFESEKKVAPREGRVPAGWLIEKVGMRGYSVGGAASSEMHANYLINKGGATAADVRQISHVIQEKVQKQFMTYLHEEPSLIGFKQ